MINHLVLLCKVADECVSCISQVDMNMVNSRGARPWRQRRRPDAAAHQSGQAARQLQNAPAHAASWIGAGRAGWCRPRTGLLSGERGDDRNVPQRATYRESRPDEAARIKRRGKALATAAAHGRTRVRLGRSRRPDDLWHSAARFSRRASRTCAAALEAEWIFDLEGVLRVMDRVYAAACGETSWDRARGGVGRARWFRRLRAGQHRSAGARPVLRAALWAARPRPDRRRARPDAREPAADRRGAALAARHGLA